MRGRDILRGRRRRAERREGAWHAAVTRHPAQKPPRAPPRSPRTNAPHAGAANRHESRPAQTHLGDCCGGEGRRAEEQRARGASPPVPDSNAKTSAQARPALHRNTPHTQGQRGSGATAVGKRTLVLGGVGKKCVRLCGAERRRLRSEKKLKYKKIAHRTHRSRAGKAAQRALLRVFGGLHEAGDVRYHLLALCARGGDAVAVVERLHADDAVLAGLGRSGRRVRR